MTFSLKNWIVKKIGKLCIFHIYWNGEQKKDKQLSTKHNLENQRLSNTNPTKTTEMNSSSPEGIAITNTPVTPFKTYWK
jgi:hypothetical protein